MPDHETVKLLLTPSEVKDGLIDAPPGVGVFVEADVCVGVRVSVEVLVGVSVKVALTAGDGVDVLEDV